MTDHSDPLAGRAPHPSSSLADDLEGLMKIGELRRFPGQILLTDATVGEIIRALRATSESTPPGSEKRPQADADAPRLADADDAFIDAVRREAFILEAVEWRGFTRERAAANFDHREAFVLKPREEIQVSPQMQHDVRCEIEGERYTTSFVIRAVDALRTDAPSRAPSSETQSAQDAPSPIRPCPKCGSMTEYHAHTDTSPASSEDGEPAQDEPRFFIEHGRIHDRATGQHVTTDPDGPFDPGITEACALLNDLARHRGVRRVSLPDAKGLESTVSPGEDARDCGRADPSGLPWVTAGDDRDPRGRCSGCGAVIFSGERHSCGLL